MGLTRPVGVVGMLLNVPPVGPTHTPGGHEQSPLIGQFTLFCAPQAWLCTPQGVWANHGLIVFQPFGRPVVNGLPIEPVKGL